MREPIISVVSNKRCTLVPRVPISINNALFIKDLAPEHYGAIALYNEKYEADILPSQKSILIDPTSALFAENELKDIFLGLSFSVNFFREKGIFNVSEIYTSQHKRKFKIIGSDRTPIGELLLNNSLDFAIKKETAPEQVEQIFTACLRALKKDKSFEITLKRFILAISRGDYQSKVIDISIALESLYSFQSEISFRFSLYNSLITAENAEKRSEIFDIMKALYDERSSIVHGTNRQKKALVEESWDKIVDITRYAILYKLNFLQTEDKANWDKHLLNLSMGAQLRA